MVVMVPSFWLSLLASILLYLIFQYAIIAINIALNDQLVYPYDFIGMTSDPTNRFGSRKWGCSSYQNMSAGVIQQGNVNTFDRVIRAIQFGFYFTTVVACVLFSSILFFSKSYFGISSVFALTCFWPSFAIIIVAALNMLFSSLSQLFYIGHSSFNYQKQVCFDLAGTVAQSVISPTASYSTIASVWSSQVVLNFIFGLFTLVMLSYSVKAMKWDVNETSIVKLFYSDSNIIIKIIQCGVFGGVILLYCALLLSLIIGPSVNEDFKGYPNKCGEC